MKKYEKQRSTVKPVPMVVDVFSVWIYTDIKEINEDESVEYEFDMVQYEKDEYIKMMVEKNVQIESQLIDTQIALTEIYENVGV